MGIFDGIGRIIKGQLIDVIEWTDDSKNTMVYRFDMQGKEIMNGAMLTVRESQTAILVSEGQIGDIYGPGLHKLTSSNMPVITALKSWKYGFESPFKLEVYFINMRQFTDIKWGTTNPVMMRDADFGLIRLRGYGIFAFKVVDPLVFLREVFGTNSMYTVEDISGQLKKMLVSGISDAIAESKVAALDLAANYDEFGKLAKDKMNAKVSQYGFQLTDFTIENLSLPEEVEKAMDTRTSMGVIGDMGKFTQFQAAQAMREAANNPSGGGAASMGVGLGAGVTMGQVMGGALGQSFTQPQQPNTAQNANNTNTAAAASLITCPSCNKQVAKGKFCPECGAEMVKDNNMVKCISCGAEIVKDAKFCPECGAKQSLECPNCGHKHYKPAKIFPECGQKL